MNETGRQITIYEFGRIGRIRREQLTLEGLAEQTGIHPTLIEQFVEYGLVEPSERMGARLLFELDCVVRVRKIVRLRHDLGANLASVAVILDLLDRISRLEKEVERLQRLER
ncbi:MAG TPA: chaperone modulator CbpM [Blastocatellia bacterium]|nr:chaperone modulator CbpM [Blastocatellia bacterium]